MDEHVLHLTDGSTVSAKVNFATLYYMEKSGVDDIVSKYSESDKEELNEADALEVAARMLHVLLLSNGRQCTFQEALVLCPLDTDEVTAVFEDFKARLSDYKKKQDAKKKEREFLEKQNA